MFEELQLINHWLQSKDVGFLQRQGLDNSYFFALRHVVDWIESHYRGTDTLPSTDLVCYEFEEFRKLHELDSTEYLTGILRENKAYTQYRPVLEKHVQLVNDGKAVEAMWQLRADIDQMLKQYTSKTVRYDWVRDAIERYNKYMEKHGKEGLQGLPTGIKGLDEATGGWREDDLILLAGRTNEGKSLCGGYFAYTVWRALKSAGVDDRPVVYITTEMPEIEVAYRLDTLRSHFSNRALNEGRLQDPCSYKEYLEELSSSKNSFIILSQEANGGKPFTPADIRSVIEQEKPAFMVIDQLYDLSDGTGERDIRKRIVNVSTQIREVNLYTKTPILLVAQAGRNAAKEAKKDPNATPDIFDIQESDNPAQKATRVITIRLIEDVFKLSLKKNRGGKRDMDFYMRADLDTGIWEESTTEESVF